VRSELNGRDTFSANGGRALNFEDVPPELMAGIDVYKNPSAEQIEGAIGGLVNLRTALPFDYKGFRGAVSLGINYSELPKKSSPSASALLSNTWDTEAGRFGALLSVAHSKSATRNDTVQVEPYFLIDADRTDADTTRKNWVPRGVNWRTLEFERTRDGLYGALQWKKNDLSSSLSYFHSRYKMHWTETANFGQVGDPYKLGVQPGAVYDANNVLVKGTLYEADFGEGGMNFGADSRYATRNSTTRELGWNLKYKASDRWSFSTDVQLIRSRTQAEDYTVGTGVILPSETIDLSGSIPRVDFSAQQLADLLDPMKNYWGFTMEHLEKSKASSKAVRGDATLTFDDPVLRDLRFGVRFTDRDARTTRTPEDYHWAAITQTWQRGWAIKDLAYVGDPRFAGGTYTHSFDNYFGGKVSVPPMLMSLPSLARNGYPAEWARLHGYATQVCDDQYGGPGTCPSWTGHAWSPSTFGTDPLGDNDQHERTKAAYAQLRFGFDDWKMPVDGNVGLRVVRTDMSANGYTVFTIDGLNPAQGQNVGGVPIPPLSAFATPIVATNDYTNVLPSVNLRMKAAPDLQFRLGWAQAVARPDFSDMQAYSALKMGFDRRTDPVTGDLIIDRVNLTGEAKGNPLLKPVKSNQLDLTAEWYFARNASFTLAVFNKQLKDIIVKQQGTATLFDSTGTAYTFTTTSPVNGAKGHARGFEVAFQRYFDMLPGWLSGFGVQANYTFVDSKVKPYNSVYTPLCSGTDGGVANLNLRTNGCDTDGRSFEDLPLPNLSRNAYNLALLYDHEPLSARIAYSWRSKYLQQVYANGTNGTNGRDAAGNGVAWALPTWNDSYGQFDGGISWKPTENMTLSLEGQNLTNKENRQLMQQHIGLMTRGVMYTGRRYTAQVAYTF